MLATAHRGDSSVFRENTIDAIESAIDKEADIVEIDVRLSKDGTVIVLHDETVERLWGYSSLASELTIEQIRELGFDSYRIPTLAETVELFKNSSTHLMIDMDTPLLAAASFDVVSESRIDPEKIIWCGNLEGMKIIRGLSRSARIWMPWNENKPVDEVMLRQLAPEYINSHYSYWDEESVRRTHEAGVKTSAWTVDDRPTMRWVKSIGIDSVTTNNLSLLQRVIAEESLPDPLDLDAASELAQAIGAWAIFVCNFMKPGDVKTKVNPADLVTEVDLFIERHIREMIKAVFPTHNIVGEEFGGEYDAHTPSWYIDPVDGTTNFANNTPWSSLSLALAVGRDPLVAVTIDPWRNKLFYARKGAGATVNGQVLTVPERLKVPEGTELAGKVVLTELSGSAAWQGMHKFIEKLNENFCTTRIMGAGTLTLTSTSANYGIGAVVHRFSPIDHLAAALIARETGCVVFNENGEEELFPTTGGMLIVQPVAAKILFKLWKESITNN